MRDLRTVQYYVCVNGVRISIGALLQQPLFDIAHHPTTKHHTQSQTNNHQNGRDGGRTRTNKRGDNTLL